MLNYLLTPTFTIDPKSVLVITIPLRFNMRKINKFKQMQFQPGLFMVLLFLLLQSKSGLAQCTAPALLR